MSHTLKTLVGDEGVFFICANFCQTSCTFDDDLSRKPVAAIRNGNTSIIVVYSWTIYSVGVLLPIDPVGLEPTTSQL